VIKKISNDLPGTVYLSYPEFPDGSGDHFRDATKMIGRIKISRFTKTNRPAIALEKFSQRL
jgi:hypothetical protein